MSEKKHDDGGPAYPHDADYVRGGKPGKYIFKVPFAPGMTLLDAFAMEAMVALMEGSSCWDVSDETQVAKKAYSIARAMVVEKRRLEAKR